MKIVKEYIVNEKFTEESDPIRDLEIGMTPLIRKWLYEMYIKNYRINKDGSISVKERIDLHQHNLFKNFKGELPNYIKFKRVLGDFRASDCELISLRGVPQIVQGNFCVGFNQLTSLKYGPKFTAGGYYCHNNNLKSLEGVAEIITGVFECSGQIIEFDPRYLPKIVGEEFRHRLEKNGKPVTPKEILKYVKTPKDKILYRTD
jgi:hypothetical protein